MSHHFIHADYIGEKKMPSHQLKNEDVVCVRHEKCKTTSPNMCSRWARALWEGGFTVAGKKERKREREKSREKREKILRLTVGDGRKWVSVW